MGNKFIRIFLLPISIIAILYLSGNAAYSLSVDFTVIKKKEKEIRKYNILEYDIDVSIDYENKKLDAVAEVEFEPESELVDKISFMMNGDYEIRSIVLGHTMRAGSPNVFDRIVGLRFGYHAMSYIIDGHFGKLTSLKGTEIVPVDLVEGAKKCVIDPSSDLVEIRDIMVSVKQRSKERIGWL